MTPDKARIDAEDRHIRRKDIETALAQILHALRGRFPLVSIPTFAEKAETVRLAIELAQLHRSRDVESHLPEAAMLLAKAGLALGAERDWRPPQEKKKTDAEIRRLMLEESVDDAQGDELLPRGYFFGRSSSPLPARIVRLPRFRIDYDPDSEEAFSLCDQEDENGAVEKYEPTIPLFQTEKAFKEFLGKVAKRTGAREKPAWDEQRCAAVAASWLAIAKTGQVSVSLYGQWVWHLRDRRRAQTETAREAKIRKAAANRAKKLTATDRPSPVPTPRGKAKGHPG